MDNNIITQDERNTLNKTMEYRQKILNTVFEKGAPTEASKIEAINSVLSSMDKAVYDSVNARLKYQDTQNTTVMLDTIAEVIKTVQTSKNDFIKQSQGHRQLTLPEERQSIELVPGEGEVVKTELALNDFTKGE